MTNLLEEAINSNDANHAAKMIREALGIESDDVANYVFPKTWPNDREQRARIIGECSQTRGAISGGIEMHGNIGPPRRPQPPRWWCGVLTCFVRLVAALVVVLWMAKHWTKLAGEKELEVRASTRAAAWGLIRPSVQLALGSPPRPTGISQQEVLQHELSFAPRQWAAAGSARYLSIVRLRPSFDFDHLIVGAAVRANEGIERRWPASRHDTSPYNSR